MEICKFGEYVELVVVALALPNNCESAQYFLSIMIQFDKISNFISIVEYITIIDIVRSFYMCNEKKLLLVTKLNSEPMMKTTIM
ncbi:hypothetical protein BLOT_014933 [Blomia tropicalis]|nr:hypothetical protein BLOT_014933 [Blomia tropicalis]